MTDRKALPEWNDPPEDVAALYSWANLHGAKYRDFSASPAQTRESARQPVQEAIEAGKRRACEEDEAQKHSEAKAADDVAIQAEAQRKQEEAVREQARKAEQMRSAQAARPASPSSQPADQPLYAGPANPYAAANQPTARAQAPVAPREEQFRRREDHFLQVRNPWSAAETREPAGRPAWLLSADRADAPSPPVVPPPPEDAPQSSRDRLTSRWFALNGLFAGAVAPVEAVPAAAAQRAPVLAVFSLAGGVGKTSLVATLGRVLSARGERVMLVDTAVFGLLPFFFGARDQRPGILRTFMPPDPCGDAPIQMISIDPESLGPESGAQETLTQEIVRNARGAGRVIIDLATASEATTRRVLRLSPTVLVPVVPDMSSVVSVSTIDSFFQHNVSASGQAVRPYYVLNQFDPSLPLDLDVREVLREQLGERLLPFALRRTPAVSEALAEGMTVVDYAPNSTVTEDFGNLAGWVKSLAAPAGSGYRGVRWSEK